MTVPSAGHRYYQPGELGFEAKIKEWYEKLKQKKD